MRKSKTKVFSKKRSVNQVVNNIIMGIVGINYGINKGWQLTKRRVAQMAVIYYNI